jgi:transketolase
MMVLFHCVLQEEDGFILSKGHSAGALYVTLWSRGKISEEKLATFCRDNTALAAHPSGGNIPGLMFPTGSLGHGPSLAAGLALAAKTTGSRRSVYCLCSDAEWQEGSCWEALIFSVHHALDNLVILIDQNNLQGFGTTRSVVSCSNLEGRIASFGVEVISCNGHDPGEILEKLNKPRTRPKVILLNTIKGKGTLFENKLESHYLPLTKENLEFSIQQLQPTTES